jgi:hypothetical protein
MVDLIQTVYGAIVDILGADVGNRVYFVTMPPDAVFPLVVYGPVFGGHGVRASGENNMYRSRHQIDIYAPTVAELMALRHTAIVALENYGDGVTIIGNNIDTDVSYYVDELDMWRHIIDVSFEGEWES